MIYRAAPGTIMTPEVLSKYIGQHKAEVGKRLRGLDSAYRGDYDIFHCTRKPAWKPDNRIAFGFAKYIVDTMNGYFMGVPVRISHQDKTTSEYLEFLKQYN